MSDLVCLGDVITLEYGRSLPAALRRAGNVPVYGSNGITGWHDEALIEGPVIVVGRKGSIGEVQYEPGPAFPIDTTYYAQPRPGVSVDFRYLFYMLRVAGLTELNSGTGVPGLNREHAYRVRTRLPPLDEQRRIVGLLDRAAEIRRHADAARAKARTIIPALFLDTFGDPATNPKAWPVATVSDVLDSASYGTSQKASDAGGGLPVIRMGNVTMNGQLDTTDLKYMELTEAEREKAELLEGDLLFNRTNSKELVGKTGLWDGRFNAVAASYFIRLRVNRKRIVPAYLWAFFNTSHMKRVLFQTARGAIGQANINAKELRAFPVATPSLPLQTAFAEQVSRINSLARRLDAAASKAEAMAAGLSAEVFDAGQRKDTADGPSAPC